MNKKLIGFSLGATLLFSGQNAFAEEALKAEIVNSHNSIELDWNDVGERYQIFIEDKKLWEGETSEFIHTGLQSDFKYNYQIIAFNELGEQIDQLEVRTTTKFGFNDRSKSATMSLANTQPAQSNEENQLNSISVSSTVNDGEIQIEWDGQIPDDDQIIEVYRDGALIKTTTDNFYTDTNIDYDQQYNYEFLGRKKLPEEQIEDIKKAAEKEGTEITPDLERELYYDTYILSREVNTKKVPDSKDIDLNTLTTKAADSMVQAASSTNFTLRYSTFIPGPDPYVPNPFRYTSDVEYFNTNRRGFDKNSTTYKTRMDVSISFPGGIGDANLYSTNKKVEETLYYDKNYNIIGRDTASASGMGINLVERAQGRVSFHAHHDIGIPYRNYMTPDITYSFKIHVYPDGGYVIRGSHDKAPSHEIYLTNNDGIIRNIHRASHVDFKYLLPTYSNYTIAASY